jgi:hypothetical protein
MEKTLTFTGYSIADKLPNQGQNVLIKVQGIDEIAPAVFEEFEDEGGKIYHIFKDPYYGQEEIYAIEEVIEWYEHPNF